MSVHNVVHRCTAIKFQHSGVVLSTWAMKYGITLVVHKEQHAWPHDVMLSNGSGMGYYTHIPELPLQMTQTLTMHTRGVEKVQRSSAGIKVGFMTTSSGLCTLYPSPNLPACRLESCPSQGLMLGFNSLS